MTEQPPFRFTFVEHASIAAAVVHFELFEAISSTYSLSIALHPQGELPVSHSELTGTAVRLDIDSEGRERSVHGVVASVALDHLESVVLRLVVVPRLETMSIGDDSRIFQDMSVVDIVSALFDEHGVSYDLRLASSYEKREYCVQYRESALAFVQRILADEGIFYFFEHDDDDQERVVLGDYASAYKSDDNSLAYRPEGGAGMRTEQAAVLRLWAASELSTQRVALSGYDFTHPASPVAADAPERDATSPSPRGPREHFDPRPSWHHHGGVETRAAVVLEQATRQATRRHGTSLSRRLAAGHVMKLAEHPIEELNGEHVVVQARHEGRGSPEIAAGKYAMITSFQSVAAESVFRPPLPQRVLRQVIESAQVVGPSHEQIYTDEHGRIKVQFHWDRDGKLDDHSSCWMRVMQPWSGPGMGMQFVPRVGSEVLVTFLGGNTDQPIVLGGVHNPTNNHPFALPDNRNSSGIRSGSVGGDGYNELRFDDTAGEEKVSIVAQNNFAREVGGDSAATVARSQTTQVGGDSLLSVGKSLEQEAGADIAFTAGGQRRDAVGAAYEVRVAAELTTQVGSHVATTVGGNLIDEVAQNAVCTVEGVLTTTARGGRALNVGDPGAPASNTTFVHGPQTLGGTETITVNSEQEIRLVCGETIVALSPDGVSITSPNVTIRGEDETQVFGKDAQVLLGADAEVSAPHVNMIASGSSVELNSNANIFGSKVNLNCERGFETEISESEETPETTTLDLVMTDAKDEPYANKQYVMIVDGVRYAGETGGDGSVSQDIPKDAASASLQLWTDEYPQGPRRVFELQVGGLETADTLDGARERLKNLGYAPGTGDDMDNTTRDALEKFQQDRDLDPTGDLDEATIAALNE